MGARSSRRGGGGYGGTGQDFELNLAPIIDCFTFIIVFLLTSASFVSVGVLDVNMASPLEDAAVAATSDNQTPDVTLRVREPGFITIEIKPLKGVMETMEFPPEGGALPIAAVTAQLQKLKETSPELSGATILASDGIKYKDLVHTVESVRAVLPGVSIGNRPLEAK